MTDFTTVLSVRVAQAQAQRDADDRMVEDVWEGVRQAEATELLVRQKAEQVRRYYNAQGYAGAVYAYGMSDATAACLYDEHDARFWSGVRDAVSPLRAPVVPERVRAKLDRDAAAKAADRELELKLAQIDADAARAPRPFVAGPSAWGQSRGWDKPSGGIGADNV